MALRTGKTLSFKDLMGNEQEVAPGRSKEMDQLRTLVEGKGLIEQLLGVPLTLPNLKAIVKELKGSNEQDAGWGVEMNTGDAVQLQTGQVMQPAADPVKNALEILEKLPDTMTVKELKKQMRGEK